VGGNRSSDADVPHDATTWQPPAGSPARGHPQRLGGTPTAPDSNIACRRSHSTLKSLNQAEPAGATLEDEVGVEDATRGWSSRRWLTVTAACVLLSAGAGMWATRHSLARWLRRQPSVVASAVEATATPRATLPVTPPAPAAPVPVATPTVVLQMATFQSSARCTAGDTGAARRRLPCV
jgi:hypothetical protein